MNGGKERKLRWRMFETIGALLIVAMISWGVKLFSTTLQVWRQLKRA